MTGSNTPVAGGVLSADIAVPDHERVVTFYARVLGTGRAPLWRPDLMNNAGTPIIGVGERVEAYQHLPLQWMPHIQVADVAVSVRRALELGGVELMSHTGEDGGMQWAVLRDPDGATFGFIPPVPAEAAAAVGEGVGRIAWMDLTVPDADRARAFYEAVVGWTSQEVEMEDADGRYADYAMAATDGRVVAGVCHARGVNRGLPPVWLIYLPVGDLEESLRRVEEEGGEVLRRPEAGSQHPYAVIRDPAGASLALMQG